MQEFNGRVFKKLGDRFLGSITLDYIGAQHHCVGVESSNREQPTAQHFRQSIVIRRGRGDSFPHKDRMGTVIGRVRGQMSKIGQDHFLARLGILQRNPAREAALAIRHASFGPPRL